MLAGGTGDCKLYGGWRGEGLHSTCLPEVLETMFAGGC